MEEKLFLGIADNDRFASVVVGDSKGRIIATSVGGSINYRYWGMEQARANLMNIIIQTVGWDRRITLAGVCFTYKADYEISDWRVPELISGFLEKSFVTVEDFATSSILGMRGRKDRLLLVGGHSSLAIVETPTGQSLQMRQEAPVWDLNMRLNAKLATLSDLGHSQDVEDLLVIKDQVKYGQCLATITGILDELADTGSSVVLELAYDMAYDLVKMVTNMATHFCGLEPVIGLYGQMLLGSETIRERVAHLIGLLFPDSRIVHAPLAPAKGAYLSSVLARRSGFEQEVITNLFNSTRDREGWIHFGSYNKGD